MNVNYCFDGANDSHFLVSNVILEEKHNCLWIWFLAISSWFFVFFPPFWHGKWMELFDNCWLWELNMFRWFWHFRCSELINIAHRKCQKICVLETSHSQGGQVGIWPIHIFQNNQLRFHASVLNKFCAVLFVLAEIPSYAI